MAIQEPVIFGTLDAMTPRRTFFNGQEARIVPISGVFPDRVEILAKEPSSYCSVAELLSDCLNNLAEIRDTSLSMQILGDQLCFEGKHSSVLVEAAPPAIFSPHSSLACNLPVFVRNIEDALETIALSQNFGIRDLLAQEARNFEISPSNVVPGILDTEEGRAFCFLQLHANVDSSFHSTCWLPRSIPNQRDDVTVYQPTLSDAKELKEIGKVSFRHIPL